MNNVYSYVADSNPNGAVEIINSFGYDVLDTSNLGMSLTELVRGVGEPALKKIMEYHPDKDIILELFSEKKSKKQEMCKSCQTKKSNYENYLNATGSAQTNTAPAQKDNNSSTLLANQTNVILLVSSLFIAVALIKYK